MTEVERRRRLITRALPLGIVAVISLGYGISCGVQGSPEKDAAGRYAEAWTNQNFKAMYAELNDVSKKEISEADLEKSYKAAQTVATVRTIDPDSPGDPKTVNGTTVVPVPVDIGTLAFGDVTDDLEVPYADGGVAWDPSLLFPGLHQGETLDSNIRVGKRGPILAKDGSDLASGPADDRSHDLGSAAIDVTGEVGDADPADAEKLARQGYPLGTPVGVSGLEQAFNARLAGKPGGQLIADSTNGSNSATRVLAESKPTAGIPLKTTIDPTLQQAAVTALAGRVGGIAVLDAKTGAVRALAGSAFSVPQPPGSTFKVVTTTAAFQTNNVSLDDTFDIVNGANVGGRFIYNANGEYCGGTFSEAFAESCNADFAPLGPKIGNDAFVRVAQRFGFNHDPTIYDNDLLTKAYAPDSVPKPSIPHDIGEDVDLGVTSIGQGEVLATPLEMASVAQTVANNGLRLPTPITPIKKLQSTQKPVRVMTPKLAHTLRDLMIGVVTSGTGTQGAIPEAQVAGKTGTAELGPEPGQENEENPIQIKDAWFTAFAPADKPRLAIAMVLIDAGAAGGDVAAPAVAGIFSAGL